MKNMALTGQLLDQLPAVQRLAIAYAPARARRVFLAMFLLDCRLAGIVRHSREPMLAQLRLAWWREQLGAARTPPGGEPLLDLLEVWAAEREALLPLVDGWEGMTGPAPLAPELFEQMAEARGLAFAGLARLLETGTVEADVLRMGRNWALADLAGRLGHPEERSAVLELAQAQDWRPARLGRRLRPLAVLHGLAARSLGNKGAIGALSPLALLTAMRIGILGR